MWPYWALFSFIAFGALIAPADLRRSKPLSGALLCGTIIIIIFVGLRYKTGTDWFNYIRQWSEAQRFSLGELITIHGDPGFYSLMWVLANIGAAFWVLNLICAVIFTWGLFAFAKRLPNPWLAVAIATPYLTIVIAMSGTRQATAIGFVFLALIAFSKRKTRAFLGWSAAATLFHASAVLTLPFAGLSLAKNRFQSIVLGIVIIVLAWATFGAPFALYGHRYLNEGGVQSTGLIYRVAMSSAAALLHLAVVQRRVGLDEHERTLWRNYSLVALASIAAAFVYPNSTAIDRTLLYVFPLQIFALSMVPYLVTQRGTPVFPIAIIIFYLAAILFVFLNYAVNAEDYIPYRNYLFRAA